MSAVVRKAQVVPLLYRQTAAAEFMGMSRTAFWRLVQAGTIPDGKMLPGQVRGKVWHRDTLAAVAERVKP